MNDEILTVGEMLKRARLARGWSRAELARRIGYSTNTIAKYEKAGRPDGQYPSMPRLANFVAFLDLDARLLLALCAEDRQTAQKIMDTDLVQNQVSSLADGMRVFGSLLFPNRADVNFSKEEREEAIQALTESLNEQGAPLYGRPEIEQILQSKPNKTNPEDDLRSPPGSNPITPQRKLENDDGQSRD